MNGIQVCQNVRPSSASLLRNGKRRSTAPPPVAARFSCGLNHLCAGRVALPSACRYHHVWYSRVRSLLLPSRADAAVSTSKPADLQHRPSSSATLLLRRLPAESCVSFESPLSGVTDRQSCARASPHIAPPSHLLQHFSRRRAQSIACFPIHGSWLSLGWSERLPLMKLKRRETNRCFHPLAQRRQSSSAACSASATPVRRQDAGAAATAGAAPQRTRAPQQNVPKTWIDKDTGHRVTRVTEEPGFLRTLLQLRRLHA